MAPWILMAVLLAGFGVAAGGEDLAPAVELIEGLQSGQIWAQFWGGGDTGVNALIGREPGGPREVVIPPGTQFWAQTSGRQGQSSLGASRGNLGNQMYAQMWIPTACTNINLRAPTEDDVMTASGCPNADMGKLCRSLALTRASRPAVQVAVWAVANDPLPRKLRRYLRDRSRASEGELNPDIIMEEAAELLELARLDPRDYRMFR